MKFLQLNLGRGRDAQDLLIQTAREKRADALLISEQYKWSENSAWYQDASRRAVILVCSPHLSIGDFLESNAGFVWVGVAVVRVYSCYFSPKNPFEVFETQILLLEDCLSEAVGRTLVGSDFTSKSPEWGEHRLDRKGILFGKMVARNDLIVLNQGKYFTFTRGAGGLIIDLTIAAPRLASRIGNWSVFEGTTLSDHQCIEFSLQKRSQTVDKGRGSKGRSPSWNTRPLSRERLRVHLEETRLIHELGTRCLAENIGKSKARCTGGMTS